MLTVQPLQTSSDKYFGEFRLPGTYHLLCLKWQDSLDLLHSISFQIFPIEFEFLDRSDLFTSRWLKNITVSI